MKDGKIGLLIGLKPTGEESEETPARLAAKGVMQAVEDKDAAALEEALSTFFDACQHSQSEAEAEASE